MPRRVSCRNQHSRGGIQPRRQTRSTAFLSPSSVGRRLLRRSSHPIRRAVHQSLHHLPPPQTNIYPGCRRARHPPICGAQTLQITKPAAPSIDRPASARAASRRVRARACIPAMASSRVASVDRPGALLHPRRVPPGFERAPRSSGEAAGGEKGRTQIKPQLVWFAVRPFTLTGLVAMQPSSCVISLAWPRSLAGGSQAAGRSKTHAACAF